MNLLLAKELDKSTSEGNLERSVLNDTLKASTLGGCNPEPSSAYSLTIKAHKTVSTSVSQQPGATPQKYCSPDFLDLHVARTAQSFMPPFIPKEGAGYSS
jgi:hypothetical protein